MFHALLTVRALQMSNVAPPTDGRWGTRSALAIHEAALSQAMSPYPGFATVLGVHIIPSIGEYFEKGIHHPFTFLNAVRFETLPVTEQATHVVHRINQKNVPARVEELVIVIAFEYAEFGALPRPFYPARCAALLANQSQFKFCVSAASVSGSIFTARTPRVAPTVLRQKLPPDLSVLDAKVQHSHQKSAAGCLLVQATCTPRSRRASTARTRPTARPCSRSSAT